MEKKVGQIVDVRNRRIFGGILTIDNGLITNVEECDVPETAPYIMPGFVDSHVHIESTLMKILRNAQLSPLQSHIRAKQMPTNAK
ncbi:MAG: hypothetical protein MJZ82_02515 [Paludibacteraceae bacterium]|nr:hypothetical protein [Paludibacteraceae bacterium]